MAVEQSFRFLAARKNGSGAFICDWILLVPSPNVSRTRMTSRRRVRFDVAALRGFAFFSKTACVGTEPAVASLWPWFCSGAGDCSPVCAFEPLVLSCADLPHSVSPGFCDGALGQ